jgi:hypothetical protein
MSFREYWDEQRTRQAAERQAAIEQAQTWVERRVWCSSPYGSARYGEVAGVDESGRVHVLIGYDQHDQPLYATFDVMSLGRSVWPADE